jgi:periplasmic protein CpxP/Spy
MADDAHVECSTVHSHGIRGRSILASSVQEQWTMKKNTLVLAAIFLMLAGGTAVFAQTGEGQGQGSGQWGRGPGGAPPTTEQRLQRMTQQLNLTEAQQSQIKPILENESTQMQALRADTSLSQDDRRAKMMEIRQASATQIKPILNADQQKQFDEMMSRQGRGRGNGSGPPPPQTQQPQQ